MDAVFNKEWTRSLSGKNSHSSSMNLDDYCGQLVKEKLHFRNCTSANAHDCTRSFDLYVPNSACDHKKETNVLPLVFAVHCFGCHASSMYYWAEYAEVYNFIVAIPAGIGHSFNAQHCCGPALEQNIDDVAFFQAIVHSLAKQHKGRLVSPDMVYGFGWSNGGYMVVHAAHLFRAIAPVSGYQVYDDPAQDLSNLVSKIEGRPIGLFLHHSLDDGNVAFTGCCSDPSMPECCCGLSNISDQCQSAPGFVHAFGETVNHCQGEEFVSLDRVYRKARSTMTCYQAGSNCWANTTYCVHSHGGHFNNPSFEKSFPMTGQIGDFFARDACENVGGGSWSSGTKNCTCSIDGDRDINSTATYCLSDGWKERFHQPDWENYSLPLSEDDEGVTNFGIVASSFLILLVFAVMFVMAREQKRYGQFKPVAVELTDFSVDPDPKWEDDNDLILSRRPNLSSLSRGI